MRCLLCFLLKLLVFSYIINIVLCFKLSYFLQNVYYNFITLNFILKYYVGIVLKTEHGVIVIEPEKNQPDFILLIDFGIYLFY